MDARAREARARFAEFELDLGAGELRRHGVLVAIPEQPLRVLELLVERAGVVVSREQLRARLWPADTFVDFEHGLNAAVKRLRDVLGDSADHPPLHRDRAEARLSFHHAGRRSRAISITGDRHLHDRRGAVARRGLPIVVAGVLAASAVVTVWWRGRPAASDGERTSSRRLTADAGPQPSLRRLTFDAGLQTDPTFSPDGRRLAFASNRDGNFDIWVQPLEGGDPIQLTNDPADDTQPDWSPDGNWIIFRSERTWVDAASRRSVGGLFRVFVPDGRVERITTSGYYPRVSPDGRHIVFNSSLFASAAFYLASADGSGVSRIAGAPSALAARQDTTMGWHPDGRLTFLHGGFQNLRLSSLVPGSPRLTEHALAQDVRARIAALRLRVADREPLAWSADGRTLYFVGEVNSLRSIWRVAAGDGLTIVAGPDRVPTAGGEWDGRPAAAPGGGLAFASSTSARRVWLLEVDASGRRLAGSPRPLTPPEWNVSQPSLSPDGQSLVVRTVPIGAAEQELRLLRTGEATYRRLRRIGQGESVFMTHWSPDGRRLLYGYRFGQPGARRSSIRLLDLTSLQESNITSDAPYTSADNPWGWASDGLSVLANGSRYVSGSRFALARVPLASAPAAERNATVLVSSSERGLWNATESPDGRWVCYQGSDIIQGRDSVLFVIPAAGGTPRVLAGTDEWDDYPRWAVDGRHVYFMSMRGARFGLWGVGFDPERGAGTTVRARHAATSSDAAATMSRGDE